MANRRVFILWKNPLFHESVRLLLNHPDVECVGSTTNHLDARSDILNFQPDIILLEETKEDIQWDAFEILKACSWSLRVVSLNLTDNQSCVLCREFATVNEADDLLRLVLANPQYRSDDDHQQTLQAHDAENDHDEMLA